MLWLSGKPDGHRLRELAASDGVTIPYREWWRPGTKAVILYLHGQGDHSGPFTAMGDHLHEMGFNLYAHDHRGFGLSREQRGDIATYDLFVADTMTMLQHAQRQNPAKPLFLLGLSMGGHIALRAAYRAGKAISGAVALSPGFKLRNSPPWLQVLKGAFCYLFTPRRYMTSVYGSVVTTRNQTHLDRAERDERWVTAYTARFYMETVRSIRRARREIAAIQAPTLILQAGEDYLVCPEESRRFCERIRHPDKEFRLLEGLCHNLVAEPEMPQVALQVGEWISRRIQPSRV